MTDPKQMPERIWAHKGRSPEQLGSQTWSDRDRSYGVFQQVEYIRADLTPQFDVDAIEVHLLNIERDWGLKGAVHTHVDHIRRILDEAQGGQSDE